RILASFARGPGLPELSRLMSYGSSRSKPENGDRCFTKHLPNKGGVPASLQHLLTKSPAMLFPQRRALGLAVLISSSQNSAPRSPASRARNGGGERRCHCHRRAGQT